MAKLFYEKHPHDGQLEIIYKFIEMFNTSHPVFVQCGRKFGKLLELDEELLTSNGFKKVRDVKEGEVLFGDDGKPTKVISATHPVEHNFYNVCFSDGSTIKACEEHLWTVYSKKARKAKDPNRYGKYESVTLQTKDLIPTLKYGNEWNWSIPAAKPIEMPFQEFNLDPYLLGVWLGDGSRADAHVTKNDPEVFKEFTRQRFEVVQRNYAPTKYIKGLLPHLQALNLINNKHVPEMYLYGSKEQRLALLQGLMDTDGYADKSGRVEFCSTTKDLADAAHYLACSLGCVTKRYEKIPKLYGVPKKKAYMVSFYADPKTTPVFRLQRKLQNQRARKKPNHRFIVAIEPIGKKTGRCFQVDNESHLYLASKSLIATHNTELAAFIAYLHCLLTKEPAVYYIAPFYKQAKEILWAPKRIQNFAPWILRDRPNESELRLRTVNNGFIKLDGADNIDTARGFTPSLVIYDEFKDFKPGFHVAMEPNFIARKAQLVVLGTPPELETEFFDLADRAKATGTFFQMPSSTNPYIDKEWLDAKKIELEARGEEDVWAREYEGRFVRGGSRAIFPTFVRERVEATRQSIQERLDRDAGKIQFLCVADPGTVSVFGVLFIGLNPYSRDLFVLDEIYETDPKFTSVDGIYPQIRRKLEEWDIREVDFVCDEAAAWFINEVAQRYNLHFFPSTKAQNKKDMGIGLIKDVLAEGKLTVNKSCTKFIWEMENYVKDDRGQIPKINDHLIDSFRYSLGFWNYDLNDRKEARQIERELAEDKPWYKMEDDFPELAHEASDPYAAGLMQDTIDEFEEALNDY